MNTKSVKLIILLVIYCQFLFMVTQAKHRSHRYKCPILKHCLVHKHKVCGSDKKLYDSHCHLRKASCEQNIHLKAVNKHYCDFENGVFDYEKHGTNGILDQNLFVTESEIQINDRENQNKNLNENLNNQNIEQNIKQKSTNYDNENNYELSKIEECKGENYESMKNQLIQKVMNNDLALLFAQLDENKDGQININELWKKSSIFKFEDHNQNDLLDFTEFQEAFSKSSKDTLLDVNMVSLDDSLSVNIVQTHLNDNVEIRCDIVGKPKQPTIKWYRNNVDLSTINIPNIKVFNDGLLYLSNIILSLSGNYTCQAENNSIIKQIHVLKVLMAPTVKITPQFHWANIGSSFSVSCEYHCLFDQINVAWFKNDEPIVNNQRITMLNNNTKLELNELSRSDTGAYTCRAYNQIDGAYSQDTLSLVVQDEPVSETSAENSKSRLWIFHRNGVSIHSIGCLGLLHEMDARDLIPINRLTLCGDSKTSSADDQTKSTENVCQWSENGILLKEKIYIGQPNLNRLIVFDTQHLSVSQVIATDPRPMKLWLVPGLHEQRIWLLCYGNDFEHRYMNDEKRNFFFENDFKLKDSLFDGQNFENIHIHQHKPAFFNTDYDLNENNDQFEWKSTSREQQLHNRKTIQILRLSSNSIHNENVIHLQPIDGHFDLVYNLFVPKFIDDFNLAEYENLNSASRVINSRKSDEFNLIQRYAYATHWDERTLIKIDMETFKYIKSINLADCHPIDAIFTHFGLLILQCETPVTHQLNGQLILDQITDSIIDYNTEIKAHKAYLSPNEQFLINIFHNITEFGAISSTIIVQKVNQLGLELLYDVKTTLIIVDCDFVWKNGNFDAILVSGSFNREDAIYLTLVDGKVELINGIGKPSKMSKRKISIKNNNKLGAVTSAQSVFVVNLNNNKVQCETDQQHTEPNVIIWT